jgi:AcrR family transcriptional regulator
VAEAAVSGRATRWREHKAERRQRIVSAAIRAVEAAPAGAELSVQRVADEAGLVRTVIYRHFEGKPDLFRAVQAQLVATLRDRIDDELRIDRSVQEILNAAVAACVGWADEHPDLYMAIEREVGDGRPSEMSIATEHIAQRIMSLMQLSAGMLEAKVRGVDYATLETVVYGMIGQVRGTLVHWIRLAPRVPGAGELAAILSRSLWLQIAGQAKDIGLELNASTAVRELFTEGRRSDGS